MRTKKGYVIQLLIGFITTIGVFSLIMTAIIVTNKEDTVENNIKNEITNTIVNYDELNINDVSEAIEVATKKVEAAVIGITAKSVTVSGTGPFKTEVEDGYSTGSGVIYKRFPIYEEDRLVSYQYYVITNRHVVTLDQLDKEKFDHLNIYAYLGEEDIEIKANLIGYDSKVDIALISFETTKLIEPVEFADSSKVNKGSIAIAIGNPGGYDYYGSVTFGVVSGPSRYISTDTDGDQTDDFYAEYIQHDVAINPGNSGGGLFNLSGQLIGINTLKIVKDTVDSMGFAIPSNVVYNLITEYLEKGKEPVRPRLGVLGSEIRSLTDAIIQNSPDIIGIPDIYNGEQAYGIYVVEVYENTTVGQTNIGKDDIILEINGIKLTRMYIVNSKFNSLIEGFQVGEEITITYYDRSLNQIVSEKVILKP